MLGICRYYCCVASAHCVHIIPYFIRHIFTEAPLIPSLAWQSSSGQRWWRHWLWEIVIRMTDAPISMFYFWPVKIIAERGWVRSARQQSDVSRDWEWLTETRRDQGYWGPGSPVQLLKLCRRGESGVMIMSSGAVMESPPGSVSIILIRENISWASGQKPAQLSVTSLLSSCIPPGQLPLPVQKCFVERHDNFQDQFTRFANSFWANFQFRCWLSSSGRLWEKKRSEEAKF